MPLLLAKILFVPRSSRFLQTSAPLFIVSLLDCKIYPCRSSNWHLGLAVFKPEISNSKCKIYSAFPASQPFRARANDPSGHAV
jgi:hypothetical protein